MTPNKISQRRDATIYDGDGKPKKGHVWVHNEGYTFSKYMVISFTAFQVLRDAKLSGNDRIVLDYIMQKIEYGNIAVGFNRTECSEQLGISKPNISRHLSTLEKSKLILRGHMGIVHLNPELAFCGPAKEQKFALTKWYSLIAKKRKCVSLESTEEAA